MSSRTCSYSKPILTRSKPIHINHSLFSVGDKVTVNHSLGTIRYIGVTDFKAGTWIGIELDKLGTGKNDGSIEGKRYFVCPPNTGLFILESKLTKQQYEHNRPSTPYQKLKPSLPLTPPNSHTPLPPVSTKNELFLLEKRVQALESENQQLKETIQKWETKHKNLKKTSMESIEILGKMLQSQYEKLSKKNRDLCIEKQELEQASLEAIASYETSLQNWEITKRDIQQTTDRYRKDIAMLEFLLQKKGHKENDLIRKERQYSGRLVLELKYLKQQHDMLRWSYKPIDRLDTPIEEEEEEEDCSLCDQRGHDLLHCQLAYM